MNIGNMSIFDTKGLKDLIVEMYRTAEFQGTVADYAKFLRQLVGRLEEYPEIIIIWRERVRQVDVVGFATEHDDQHLKGDLASVGICYALLETGYPDDFQRTVRKVIWPWSGQWWKPKDPESNLARAAALIAAELGKLLRQEKKDDTSRD